jgi:hypothetical protein
LSCRLLWAEKIQSTTDAGSLNTFGRNEIEVAPISSVLLRIACSVILYKTCRLPRIGGWVTSCSVCFIFVSLRERLLRLTPPAGQSCAGSELSLRCEYRCEPAALMVTTCPVPGPVLRSSGRRSIREPRVVHLRNKFCDFTSKNVESGLHPVPKTPS